MTRRGWALFLAMCVLWGLPYLLIRVAVRDLSPSSIIFARTAFGALLLTPVAAWRGVLPTLRGHWRWVLLYTAVELALPWLLITRAEEHLTSSLTGLLVAAVPLVGIVLSRAIGRAETLSARRWTGLLVGIGGVAALVGLQVGSIDLSAVVEVMVVAVGYAAGPLILAYRLAELPGLAVVAASLVVTAIVYAPFAALSRPHEVHAKVVWSVVGLVLLCTVAAYLVFFELVAAVGPNRATVVTYVNPAVAIALGVGVLGEPLTAGILVGFPLVLIGSVLATHVGAARTEPIDTRVEPLVTPG